MSAPTQPCSRAYVQPAAERYLSRLHNGLKDKGFAKSPYIMQSNCGVDSLESVKSIPITMVESGPASGFWGAAELGKLIGEPNVLALDIGGTTAKCSLIENGEVKIKTDYWIERDRTSAGYPIMVPVVDLVEIGNGGGSIAWVDDFGKLHVGPQSAGALPGPAAYGRGGTKATTTDANLWLGRINRDYFCGGEIVADMEAAGAAIKAVGEKLGVDADEAARGIVRIANNNMVNALKLVSLNRGHDPARLHAGRLRRRRRHACGRPRCRTRRQESRGAGGGFGVLGLGHDDVRPAPRLFRYAARRSQTRRGGGHRASRSPKAKRAPAPQFAAEGIGAEKVQFLRYGKFRYQNQEHTTEVLISGGEISDARLVRDRSGIPRDLRARIHLSAAGAGRDGRHPSRRVRARSASSPCESGMRPARRRRRR